MFADGRTSVGFKHFLGYDRGPNGEFIINEEQAVTVRYIYKRYLEGLSTYKIAAELTGYGSKDSGWEGQMAFHFSNEHFEK